MKENTDTKLKKVNKLESNSELIVRKEVKDTPFTIISIKNKNEHFGALGEYRITEIYNTVKKVEEEVKKVTWNRIIQVNMILIEKMKKNNITIKK